MTTENKNQPVSDWSSFKTPADRWTVNNSLSDKKPTASLLQPAHCPWPLPQDGPALGCFNSSTSFLVHSGNREFSLPRCQRHFHNWTIRAPTLSFLFTVLGQKPEGKKNQNRIARTFFYKSTCLCWNGVLGHWQSSIAQGSPSASPVWTSEM